MRVFAFIIGMIFAALAVGIWSFVSGASVGTTVLRVIVTLVAAQALYVVAVLLMTRVGKTGTDTSTERAQSSEAADLIYPGKQKHSSSG